MCQQLRHGVTVLHVCGQVSVSVISGWIECTYPSEAYSIAMYLYLYSWGSMYVHTNKLTHTTYVSKYSTYTQKYVHTYICMHAQGTKEREWNSREKGGELHPMLLLLGSVVCHASPYSLRADHCSAHP